MIIRATLTGIAVATALLISADAWAQSCPNGVWCGPGRGCCNNGKVCAPSGGCMPPGHHDCGVRRGTCPPAYHCAPTKGCIRGR